MTAVRTVAEPRADPVELLAAALRGRPAPCPDRLSADALREAAVRHGVQWLLAQQLAARDGAVGWPVGLLERLARGRRRAAVMGLLRDQELTRVLAGLAERGLRAALMKGAALAHSHYPEPALRPRLDADVLVDPAAREPAAAALGALGYRLHALTHGSLLSTQSCWRRIDEREVVHTIDLHWAVSNSAVLARVIEADEALAAATPVPALGPAARGLEPVHALLLALLHRAFHRHQRYIDGPLREDRLIWLYDIHLLASRFDAEQWERLVSRAVRRRAGRLCRDGLVEAAGQLETVVPARVLERLARPRRELSSAYIESGGWRPLVAQLRAQPGGRRKLQFIWQHLVPPLHYAREQAGAESGPLRLLGWYVRRAVSGLRRRVARS